MPLPPPLPWQSRDAKAIEYRGIPAPLTFHAFNCKQLLGKGRFHCLPDIGEVCGPTLFRRATELAGRGSGGCRNKGKTASPHLHDGYARHKHEAGWIGGLHCLYEHGPPARRCIEMNSCQHCFAFAKKFRHRVEAFAHRGSGLLRLLMAEE